jgi:hypothetical protein
LFADEISRQPAERRRILETQLSQWAMRDAPGQPRDPSGVTIVPREFLSIAEWLVAGNTQDAQRTAMSLAAGIQDIAGLRLALASAHKPGAQGHLEIVVRSSARRSPRETAEELWKSVVAATARGDDAALAALAGTFDVLPTDELCPLLERAAREGASDYVRVELYATLASVKRPPASLATLFQYYPTLPTSARSVTRAHAITRFADALYEPALPLIGEALRDENPEVRNAAREALEDFRKQREALEEFDKWMRASNDERETIAQLEALLASKDRAVVLGAVKALHAVRARSALPALVKLLARNETELREAVEAAIQAMSGEPAPKRSEGDKK